jgi:hypothetical protein
MNTLVDLLKVSEQDRNFAWEEKFFKKFSDEQVRLLSKDPQQGPDGWPYLICETFGNQSDDAHEVESTQKVFHWLSTRGIGLVVNPRREPYPDYVFSYGMIWSFRETGFFMRPDLANKTGEAVFENTKITSGAPTEQFLPLYVRKVLKDFFRDQSVLSPKVLMISQDGTNYDLCFSLESLGNPPAKEHAGVAEAIAWFLPPHYSVVLISDKNLPEFISL